jgi:hypothetical protein
MASEQERFRQILERAQGLCLYQGTANPSREDVVSYFNAAVNSAAGAFVEFYKGKPETADLAIYGALRLWVSIVEDRIKDAEGSRHGN